VVGFTFTRVLSGGELDLDEDRSEKRHILWISPGMWEAISRGIWGRVSDEVFFGADLLFRLLLSDVKMWSSSVMGVARSTAVPAS